MLRFVRRGIILSPVARVLFTLYADKEQRVKLVPTLRFTHLRAAYSCASVAHLLSFI